MIAKQSVYKTSDGRAVPEGDKDARFLLCREGAEVNEATLEPFDGAVVLANSTAKKAVASTLQPSTAVENNDPEPENRDPVSEVKKGKGQPKKGKGQPKKGAEEPLKDSHVY